MTGKGLSFFLCTGYPVKQKIKGYRPKDYGKIVPLFLGQSKGNFKTKVNFLPIFFMYS